MQWQSKLSIGLLILSSSCQQVDRQVTLQPSTAVPLGKGYIISVGTVGIVSIRAETPENYELKVIFPNLVLPQSESQTSAKIWLRKNDTVSLKNSIQLFNTNGTTIDPYSGLTVITPYALGER